MGMSVAHVVRSVRLTRAFWLVVIAIGIFVLRSVLLLVPLVDAVREGAQAVGNDYVRPENLAGWFEERLPIAWIGMAVIACIGLGLAFPMRSGRGWARILLTVFGAVTVLGTLALLVIQATNGLGALTPILGGWPTALAGLAHAAAYVAAVVAMFRHRTDSSSRPITRA